MISIINEIVWKQMNLIAKDVEAFAKYMLIIHSITDIIFFIDDCRHAKRSTVNIDDVKLLVRRNEDLVS